MSEKLLIHLTEGELKNILDQSIITAFSKIPKQQKEEDQLLTRADLVRLFDVSYVTISAWCKAGTLIPHRMNSRVYFFKSEVMAELSKKK